MTLKRWRWWWWWRK